MVDYSFFAVLGCAKKEYMISLPSITEVGNSIIYADEDLTNIFDVACEIREVEIGDNTGGLTFVFKKADSEIFLTLFFGAFLAEEGTFDLSSVYDLTDIDVQAFIGYSDGEEAIEGIKYDLVDVANGYFKIDKIDYDSLTIYGEFKANFKRKMNSKGNWLTKYVTFQGVFHEYFELK